MMPVSVTVTGSLYGTVASFTLHQDFKTEGASAAELRYFVPNNGKLCMYDTTFYIGDEVIKPAIREKEEAQSAYHDAVNSGLTAMVTMSSDNGLVEFALGNVPAGVSVGVEVKVCCFCSASGDGHSLFVKFPLNVCVQTGYVRSLLSSQNEFKFTFDCSSAGDHIKEVTSNSNHGVYNKQTHIFSISEKDEQIDAVIMTIEFADALQDSVTVAGKYMAVNMFCRSLDDLAPPSEDSKKEFVFIVDCSGSMYGVKITQAKTCLDLFIRSLPVGCYFNVICFGSTYQPLFQNSKEYNQKTFLEAVKYANGITASLGGTELFGVLDFVFKGRRVCESQRRIFVLTDGFVANLGEILALVNDYRRDNRIFTLGIGSGADPGIVEGLADHTGGLSAFVSDGDNFGNKVIPELETSMKSGLCNVSIHIEGHETVESSISPMPGLFSGVATNLVLKSDKIFTGQEAVLVTGDIEQVRDVEFSITNSTCLGEHFARALESLFAYSRISKLELLLNGHERYNRKLRQELVSLSIASGILSQETSFVGCSSKTYKLDSAMDFRPERCKGGFSLTQALFGWIGDLFKKPQRAPKESRIEEEGLEKPPELTMTLVTGLQTIDGHWADVKPIWNLLEKPPRMPDITNIDEEQKKNVYNTILALAVLRHKFMADHASWKLMEQKALSWLTSVSSTTDWNTCIQEIQLQL